MSDAMMAWLVAAGALAWGIGVTIFKGGRGFSGEFGKISEAHAKDMTAMESRLAQTVAETARDLEGRIEQSTRFSGEAVSAIRQKMQDNELDTLKGMHELGERLSSVEKWARDEFVRKESLREILGDFKNSVVDQIRQVQAGMESVRAAIMSIATGQRD